MIDRRRSPWARTAALLAAAALTVTLSGCGKDPGTSAPTASASKGARTSAPAQPTRNPTEAPTSPPEGAPFTFDQAARYDDGVLVEVSTIEAKKTSPTQQGADGTGGEVVIAVIVVTNQSKQPFVADKMAIDGYYDQTGAPKIVDSSGAVGDSFKGTIPPGGQAKATFGFAMPHDNLDHVTIMVDGGDDAHGPVQFNGSVKKP